MCDEMGEETECETDDDDDDGDKDRGKAKVAPKTWQRGFRQQLAVSKKGMIVDTTNKPLIREYKLSDYLRVSSILSMY